MADLMLAPLLKLFSDAGYEAVDLPYLQPADPYLNAAGETIRQSLFVTQGQGGDVFCLRPEFTIPTCLHHIATGLNEPRSYAYAGSVFRQGNDLAAREFCQIGLEVLGEVDRAHVDAQMISLAVDAVRTCGLSQPVLTLGDPAFFHALVEPLGLADGWRKRLLRAFGDDTLVQNILKRMEAPAPTKADETLDIETMTIKVAALMEAHGVANVGGRDPYQVALRMVEKQALARPVDGTIVAALRAFLTIECPMSEVRDRMMAYGSAHGVDLGAAVQGFEARRAGLSSLDADVTFSARFGRRLDYYNGMVFEIFANDHAKKPLGGGGRYDGLMGLLGAPRDVPAAGFALRLDRMQGGQD